MLSSAFLKNIFSHIIFLFCVPLASAQSLGGLSLPDGSSTNGFASLYFIEKAVPFSHVNISMQGFEGNFNRPQTPSSGFLGRFDANGRQQQGNLIWEGRFSWQYQRDQGQQWNNTSRHPDELPYIWADEATGRWDRNHFNSSVQVGTINTGNLQFGAGLFFEGGQGDRFNDPKPLYRFRKFGIAPELALCTGKTNWLALKLLYHSFSEDNEMGGIFSVDDPLLFRLRGYATFTRTPLVSGVRQLRSQQVGGGLRWVSAKQLAVQLRGLTSWGKAEEGEAVIIPGGEWQTFYFNLLLQKSWKGRLWNTVEFSGNFIQNEGTDPIFQAINTRLQTIRARLGWQISNLDSMTFHWQIQWLASWQSRSQEDLATFTEAHIQQLPFSLNIGGKWNKGKFKPFTLLYGQYQAVLSPDLRVGSPTFISENLAEPDFEILSSDFFAVGTGVGVDIGQDTNKFRFLVFARYTQTTRGEHVFHQRYAGVSLTFSPRYSLRSPILFSDISYYTTP